MSIVQPVSRLTVCRDKCDTGEARYLNTFMSKQGASAGSVVLEEEIGTYGTGLGRRQVRDADAEYESKFGADPGHTSRAELRFNAALAAAGGRSGRDGRGRTGMKATAAPAQWEAFPEKASPRNKVEVVVEKEGAPASSAGHNFFGMTAAQARADIGGYFNSLGSQVQKQENLHAQQVLSEQNMEQQINDADGGEHHMYAGDSGHSPSLKASMKVASLFNLIRKAEASKTFKRAIVNSARSNFRGSLVGDFE